MLNNWRAYFPIFIIHVKCSSKATDDGCGRCLAVIVSNVARPNFQATYFRVSLLFVFFFMRGGGVGLRYIINQRVFLFIIETNKHTKSRYLFVCIHCVKIGEVLHNSHQGLGLIIPVSLICNAAWVALPGFPLSWTPYILHSTNKAVPSIFWCLYFFCCLFFSLPFFFLFVDFGTCFPIVFNLSLVNCSLYGLSVRTLDFWAFVLASLRGKTILNGSVGKVLLDLRVKRRNIIWRRHGRPMRRILCNGLIRL